MHLIEFTFKFGTFDFSSYVEYTRKVHRTMHMPIGQCSVFLRQEIRYSQTYFQYLCCHFLVLHTSKLTPAL